jgi:hypothetical protein
VCSSLQPSITTDPPYLPQIAAIKSIRHTLLTVLITAQILLLVLEAAVAVIQSYVLVFAVVRTLYSREVN